MSASSCPTTTPWQQIRKIDESGAYRQYDDLTTVMKARTHPDLHSPAFHAAHTRLYSYTNLISPLPLSSYHVTLVEVMGLRHMKSLAAYNANLTAITLRLDPDSVEDARRLQRLLSMARKVLGDELWVEPVGSHLTLGYKVPNKDVEKMSPVYQPIVDEMDEFYRDVKIVCEPPILASIHDMLDFPPV